VQKLEVSRPTARAQSYVELVTFEAPDLVPTAPKYRITSDIMDGVCRTSLFGILTASIFCGSTTQEE